MYDETNVTSRHIRALEQYMLLCFSITILIKMENGPDQNSVQSLECIYNSLKLIRIIHK